MIKVRRGRVSMLSSGLPSNRRHRDNCDMIGLVAETGARPTIVVPNSLTEPIMCAIRHAPPTEGDEIAFTAMRTIGIRLFIKRR